MKSFTHHSSLVTRYLDFAWLILLAAYMIAGTPIVPFHGDESIQIFMTRDYAHQFMERDLDWVRFSYDSPDPSAQYLRIINGSINKYTMGLAWHLAGFQLNDVNKDWDWSKNWDYNHENGYAPSPALLRVARIPSALFLALGAAVVFVLGMMIGGRPVAYFASLYYALNPALLINGRRAMMEGSLIASELLVVLAGVLLLRRPRWWMAALLGAAAGLALSSKHTNMFTIAAVFGACAFYPLLARRTKMPRAPFSRHLLLILLTVLVMGIVFYALNPGWWGANPVEQLLRVLRWRSDLLAYQTDTYDGYANRIDQLAGFIRQTFVNLPQYYEDPAWQTWIADQIARYEASPLRGISLGGSVPGALMLAALIGVGIWAFLRNTSLVLSTRWLLSIWMLFITLTTLLLTPLEWQRYYLPVYPVIGLLAALGITYLVKHLKVGR